MPVTQLKNYAEGKWVTAPKEGDVLHNATTGEAIYTASSEGLDFGGMMDHARKVGGPALRKLTFHQRGRMLKALAMPEAIVLLWTPGKNAVELRAITMAKMEAYHFLPSPFSI